MDISLNNIGKRYRYEWIFSGITFHFRSGQHYAIRGPNGSGKSTLLRVLSGHLTPSRGEITFQRKGEAVDIDNLYRYLAYGAPYIDLIEEFTLSEMMRFHLKFKPLANGWTAKEALELLALPKSAHKEIRYFSSGMKQRLKLLLSLCADVPLILLDEPTTNLDSQGVAWYRKLVEDFAQGKTLIVCSNVEHDFDFCQQSLNILDYK